MSNEKILRAIELEINREVNEIIILEGSITEDRIHSIVMSKICPPLEKTTFEVGV